MHQDIWCDGSSAPGGPSERTWPVSLDQTNRFESPEYLARLNATELSNFTQTETLSGPSLEGLQYAPRLPQFRSTNDRRKLDRDLRYVELDDTATGPLSEDNASMPNVLFPVKGLLNESSARSMEELTRRKRKLDHLQCCLKRYEIERAEAGQAVKRIEERLNELKLRTADLLNYSNSQPTGRNTLYQMTQPNRRVSGNLPGTKTNWMYVEAENLFHPSVSVAPTTTTYTTGLFNTFKSIDQNPFGERPLTDWNIPFAEYVGQQTPVTRKRLQEIQQHHAVLLEHLERQRNRLASADATVANLAQTLIQLSIGRPLKGSKMRPHGLREEDPDQRLIKPIPKVRNSFDELDLPFAPFPEYISDVSSARFRGSSGHSIRANTISGNAKQSPLASWGIGAAAMPLATQPLVRDSRSADYIVLYETDSKPEEPPTCGKPSAFRALPFRFGLSTSPPVNTSMYSRPAIPANAPLEVPPPLPPKPTRLFRQPSAKTEAPQTLEDEEVSKFMDPTGNQQGALVQVTSNPMKSSTSKRPPPPPYYVNLFGSETKTGHPDKCVEYGEQVPTSALNVGTSLGNMTEVDRWTKQAASSGTQHAQPSSVRRFVPPSKVCSINLMEYLEQAGYPLGQLCSDNDNVSNTGIAKGNQQSICFSALFNRWFRIGSHRFLRDKHRARSLDEQTPKLSYNVDPNRLAMESDFRVRLTRTRCGGHIWIGNSTQQQKPVHLRPRGWHSLRPTLETENSISQNLGRCSTAVGRKRENQQNWSQRWLTCDFDYRILAVYDEQNEAKQRDCIPFASMKAIHCGVDLDHSPPRTTSPTVPNWDGGENTDSTPLEPLHRVSTGSETQAVAKVPDLFELCIFQVECPTKLYTMRTSSMALRNLWITVLELGRPK
ncbi:hypothetical protein CRM22_007056 [Opisthorchis felineus]|uniref:PH domain-containing protein n=1 Tax=Opisthorchis felineus TaxID=147828 RepID=A0A4S2LJU6_OPIFE|nr:hypothetical protein CRM22_007056 [Opisthorchis felineus]